jgi:hypothetical protein
LPYVERSAAVRATLSEATKIDYTDVVIKKRELISLGASSSSVASVSLVGYSLSTIESSRCGRRTARIRGKSSMVDIVFREQAI